MSVVLWIVSGILAAAYLVSGGLKLATRRLPGPPGGPELAPGPVVAIGAAEVLGAIGLVLPWLTGVARVLTPLAATGLVVVQLAAIVFHLRRGGRQVLPANAVLLLLALFVAVLRFAGVG